MPRQSSAAAAFSTGSTTGTRSLLKPPNDLNDLERAEFVSLVLGSPPSRFLPADISVLACYAKALVAERTAARELAAAPVVSTPNGDRPSPWLPVWLGQVRAVTTLGRMLAISPASRVATKAEPPQSGNHYDRMRMLRDDKVKPS